MKAIAIALLLTACGGGDPAQCSDADSVLREVNAARSEPRQCGATGYAATRPLVMSSVLTAAAQRHAQDIARSGKASHIGSDGSTVADRAKDYGRPVGENVVVGDADLPRAMRELLASPHHCENVMNPHARAFGSACVESDRTAWVQVFGV
jgi:uncharacterized protein YkwD